MKLSEKGSEQRSEHGFGLYSGAKTGRRMPFGCLMRPRPGHLRDFSDSFRAKFAERLPTFMCVVQVHILDDTHKGGRGWLENASPLKMAVEESPLGPLRGDLDRL